MQLTLQWVRHVLVALLLGLLPSPAAASVKHGKTFTPVAQPQCSTCEVSKLGEAALAKLVAELEVHRAELLERQERLAKALQRLELANAHLPEGLAAPAEGPPRQVLGYSADPFEIEEVLRYLNDEFGAPVTRRQVLVASQTWTPEMGLEARSYRAVQAAVILVPAAVGAVSSFVGYYWDHKIHGDPFTCVGASRAVIGGAVLGAAGPAFQVGGYLLRLKYLNQFGTAAGTVLSRLSDEFAADVVVTLLNDVVGGNLALVDLALAGAQDLIGVLDLVNGFLSDAVTSDPRIRGSVGAALLSRWRASRVGFGSLALLPFVRGGRVHAELRGGLRP